MPDRLDPLGPTGRLLSAHLDRLRASLSAIGGRLREAVSTAVSHCAAEALRQALAALLRPPDPVRDTIDALSRLEDRPRLADPYRRLGQPRPDWGEPDRLDDWPRAGESRRDRRDSAGWRDDRYDAGDGYDEPEDDGHDEKGRQPSGSRWPSVLAAGCQLVAWLLGRLAAPVPGCSRWARAWPRRWPSGWPARPRQRARSPTPSLPPPAPSPAWPADQPQPQ
jgi:hypothetical protein